jgi:hypothetical protein
MIQSGNNKTLTNTNFNDEIPYNFSDGKHFISRMPKHHIHLAANLFGAKILSTGLNKNVCRIKHSKQRYAI